MYHNCVSLCLLCKGKERSNRIFLSHTAGIKNNMLPFISLYLSLSLTVVAVGPVSAAFQPASTQSPVSGVQPSIQRSTLNRNSVHSRYALHLQQRMFESTTRRIQTVKQPLATPHTSIPHQCPIIITASTPNPNAQDSMIHHLTYHPIRHQGTMYPKPRGPNAQSKSSEPH